MPFPTYNIATEITSGQLDNPTLHAEIEAAGPYDSTFIGLNSDEVDVTTLFDGPISAAQEATVTTTVQNHAGVAATKAFQFFESNPAQNISTEVWTNALTSTADATKGGIYRLTWNCELRVVPVGALNSGVVARFMVDGSRKADAYHRSVEWSAFSGFDRKVYSIGEVPLLEIDFRRDPTEGGDDQVEIRKLKIGIEFMG